MPESPAQLARCEPTEKPGGLTVGDIARAFLISERAMEQRLTRAKRKIAAADVRFEVPCVVVREERLTAVSAMIYLTFNEGYAASAQEARYKKPLSGEAIRLARLLLNLFPDEPEVEGLLALMLLHNARIDARFGKEGECILLEHQDRTLWDRAAIEEGTMLVDSAFRMHRPGQYQIQAAIAALHARAATFAETDWVQIEQLYAKLEIYLPTAVVTLNRAVAASYTRGPEEALAMVEKLAGTLEGYFYFHAVRGHLLDRMGRNGAAFDAFNTALALANSVAEADLIRSFIDAPQMPG